MQIAGKMVAHVEAHVWVMDKTSLIIAEEEIVKAINEHVEVRNGVTDPDLLAMYDEAFEDDLSRARKALDDVQFRLVQF